VQEKSAGRTPVAALVPVVSLGKMTAGTGAGQVSGTGSKPATMGRSHVVCSFSCPAGNMTMPEHWSNFQRFGLLNVARRPFCNPPLPVRLVLLQASLIVPDNLKGAPLHTDVLHARFADFLPVFFDHPFTSCQFQNRDGMDMSEFCMVVVLNREKANCPV
jgi:hypothetical protein